MEDSCWRRLTSKPTKDYVLYERKAVYVEWSKNSVGAENYRDIDVTVSTSSRITADSYLETTTSESAKVADIEHLKQVVRALETELFGGEWVLDESPVKAVPGAWVGNDRLYSGGRWAADNWPFHDLRWSSRLFHRKKRLDGVMVVVRRTLDGSDPRDRRTEIYGKCKRCCTLAFDEVTECPECRRGWSKASVGLFPTAWIDSTFGPDSDCVPAAWEQDIRLDLIDLIPALEGLDAALRDGSIDEREFVDQKALYLSVRPGLRAAKPPDQYPCGPERPRDVDEEYTRLARLHGSGALTPNELEKARELVGGFHARPRPRKTRTEDKTITVDLALDGPDPSKVRKAAHKLGALADPIIADRLASEALEGWHPYLRFASVDRSIDVVDFEALLFQGCVRFDKTGFRTWRYHNVDISLVRKVPASR